MSKHALPQCLGGGVLLGQNLVRLVYLDESGVGDGKTEPHTVVAGVLIDGDAQLRSANDAFRKIVAHHVGAKAASAHICHAKEIVAGKATGGDRDKGAAFLCDLLRLAQSMTVVWGVADRAALQKKYPDTTKGRKEGAQMAHKLAFLRALVFAEGWIRVNGKSTDLAQIYAEHSDSNKQLSEMFAGVRNGSAKPIKAVKLLLQDQPLNHFQDTVFFAYKGDNVPLLQMADICAYAIRKRLQGLQDGERFMSIIRDQMWPSAATRAWPSLKERKAGRRA